MVSHDDVVGLGHRHDGVLVMLGVHFPTAQASVHTGTLPPKGCNRFAAANAAVFLVCHGELQEVSEQVNELISSG